MSVMDIYKLAYQVTPIWLTGDPVVGLPGDTLPFAALSDPDLYRAAVGSLPNPAPDSVARDLDQAFGAFTVVPGGTLVQQVAASYPFANQHVAANATIFEPLQVSLIWDTPMRGEGAWGRKFATIGNVQAHLTAHNNGGGTYTVVTPSYIYTDMLLTNLTDSSRGSSPIPQNAWRFDFQKPLIRIEDLRAAQSQLMRKLTGGLVTDGAWSGTTAQLSGAQLSGDLVQMMELNPLRMPSAYGTLAGMAALAANAALLIP